MVKTPSTPGVVSSAPFVGFKSAGSTPKNGSVQQPGLMGVVPASGAISYDPVSVWKKVSTT